jgi:hypothetical protein
MSTLFPVYVYEEGMELPKEGTYFVVAGNGCFLHKNTGIVGCLTKVENVSILDELNAGLTVTCDLPPLPGQFVFLIKKFFELVVKNYTTEATTTLYYNKTTKEYRIHVPLQKVSHASVVYDRTPPADFDGFISVGTIHSHCDFGAFHSGVDVNDEEFFDGLHCTFGNNNKEEFSVSASIVVNGNRVLVDPLLYLNGLTKAEGGLFILDETPPEDWELTVAKWFGRVERA